MNKTAKKFVAYVMVGLLMTASLPVNVIAAPQGSSYSAGQRDANSRLSDEQRQQRRSSCSEGRRANNELRRNRANSQDLDTEGRKVSIDCIRRFLASESNDTGFTSLSESLYEETTTSGISAASSVWCDWCGGDCDWPWWCSWCDTWHSCEYNCDWCCCDEPFDFDTWDGTDPSGEWRYIYQGWLWWDCPAECWNNCYCDWDTMDTFCSYCLNSCPSCNEWFEIDCVLIFPADPNAQNLVAPQSIYFSQESEWLPVREIQLRGCCHTIGTVETLDVTDAISLQFLTAANNNLSSIDLTNNPNLGGLDISNNDLSVLNLDENLWLWRLNADNNRIASIDLRNAENLARLSVAGNNLTTLNLGQGSDLGYLDASDNNLSTIDLRNKRELWLANLRNNNLNTISLQNNVWLCNLDVSNNNLSTIDLRDCKDLSQLDVSNNNLSAFSSPNSTWLWRIDVSNNNLSAIDLRNNRNLEHLDASNNNLSAIDLRNNTWLMWLDLSNNNLSTIDLQNNQDIWTFDIRWNVIGNQALLNSLIGRFGQGSVLPQNPIVNHTVTFNSQGGSAVAARTVQQGLPIGALPTPTRANHTFAGWWTAATGGTQVTAATVVNNNMTIHARWISNAPTAISITPPASNIVVRGRTLNLGTRTNFNFNAGATQNRTVTWTSSNTRVATVDASGVVTGRNPGSATITVRSNLNTNAVATFTVRVEAAPTGINTATQNVRTIRMRQGATLSLPIVVRGSTAAALNNTPVTINWRTNNRNVVTLRGAGAATNDGRRATGSFRTNLNATRNLSVRAVRPGTTTIVLSSQNGRQRTIRVTVVRSARPVTNVRIAGMPSNNTMNRNRTRALTPRVTPTNATLQGNVRWTSSNRRVATVDGAGRVTARASGTTNITLRVGTQTHRVTLTVR